MRVNNILATFLIASSGLAAPISQEWQNLPKVPDVVDKVDELKGKLPIPPGKKPSGYSDKPTYGGYSRSLPIENVEGVKDQLPKLPTDKVDEIKSQMPNLPTEKIEDVKDKVPQLPTDKVDEVKEKLPKLPTNKVDEIKEKMPKLPTDKVDEIKDKIPKLPTDKVEDVKDGVWKNIPAEKTPSDEDKGKDDDKQSSNGNDPAAYGDFSSDEYKDQSNGNDKESTYGDDSAAHAEYRRQLDIPGLNPSGDEGNGNDNGNPGSDNQGNGNNLSGTSFLNDLTVSSPIS